MIDNNTERPIIFVDLKKCRIRIHKHTLHSIGDPKYILLLVNPEERTLAIIRSDRTDPRAHYVAVSFIKNNKTFELYSQFLVKSLKDICIDWQDGKSYRLYGEIISNDGIARFHMSDAVLFNKNEE
jgi:hypothetical protein